MSESGSSFKKWFGGILATVITGLILWWLTGPLSPFVHQNISSEQSPVSTSANNDTTSDEDKPSVAPDTGAQVPGAEKKPDISISAYSINPDELTLDEGDKPKEIAVTVEATNQGNGEAQQCRFILISDKGIIGNATSTSFSLDPGEKKSFTINATISVSADITAKLDCSNDVEKISQPVHITVWNYGIMHSRVHGS